MKVDRDIEIGGERFALLVETQHGSITARTAVHAQGFRRRIGGPFHARQDTGERTGKARHEIPRHRKSIVRKAAGIAVGVQQQRADLGADPLQHVIEQTLSEIRHLNSIESSWLREQLLMIAAAVEIESAFDATAELIH